MTGSLNVNCRVPPTFNFPLQPLVMQSRCGRSQRRCMGARVPPRLEYHRRRQGFLWGCTFFLTKNLMTFLVLTFSHPLLHGHTAINYLFISSAGCTSPNSAPFLPHSNKNAQKKIFRRPGGCTCTPLATPMQNTKHICSVKHIMHKTLEYAFFRQKSSTILCEGLSPSLHLPR